MSINEDIRVDYEYEWSDEYWWPAHAVIGQRMDNEY
jgi:hypothetical protein